MKYNRNGLVALVVASCSLLAFQAEAFDVSMSGFIRQDMAYKFSGNENQNNRGGSKYNGNSYTYDGAFMSNPLISGILGVPPTYQSKVDRSKDNDWNVLATRVELDFNANISENVKGFMKLRGIYQPDVFSQVDKSGWTDGRYGAPSNYRIENHGQEATYLSVSGTHYMADIPALYLDYAEGPFWVRLGQQQIAWGEALFFRVADLANGLDFRRHVIFDLGAEEYADERLASPGIRASMTFADNWEIEGFLQMFQPTVMPPNSSPYNVIASGFNPDWSGGYDKVDDQINGGIRLQGQGLGEQGNWGVQFFAVARHNPDPIFDLQAGGDDTADLLIEQGGINAVIGTILNGGVLGLDDGGWASQPFVFEPGGTGANDPNEWFYIAASMGADGVSVLNNVIGEWNYLTQLVPLLGLYPDANGEYFTSIEGGGHNVGLLTPNGANATDFLELFFAIAQMSGRDSLVGTLDVNYASENVFGFGTNYIFYADPEDWYDQLVIRFELAYTPNKKFTNNLSRHFLEEDELLAYAGLEKYHRFSQTFPATFFVFQYMFRKESDLLGRHLSGLGGDSNSRPGGGEDGRGFHGLAFALQQPFPNLTWRADLAVLYDMEGGFLFQPGVRYKPRADWTVEAFVNIIDGTKDSIFQPFDWSDDVTLRVTYQF